MISKAVMPINNRTPGSLDTFSIQTVDGNKAAVMIDANEIRLERRTTTTKVSTATNAA